MVDDVLGIWGDPAVTGKPVHGDLRERKKTYPVLAALDAPVPAARRLAALLESAGAPDEAAARQAAALVEEAGGRTAALTEARRQLAAVERGLDAVPLAGPGVGELRALLGFLVRRDL